MESLQFDLNELVKKEVSDHIESLEKQINSLETSNGKYYAQVKQLEKKLSNVQETEWMFDSIRKKFSELKPVPESSNEFSKTLQHAQFDFIRDILKNLFGVINETDGFIIHTGLWPNLAINYYQNKETLIRVLNLVMPENNDLKFKINSFKMPYDYDKTTIVKFVESPPSCTNGCYFGMSRYWVGYGASEKSNTPYNLLMANKHIIEPDVFEKLIKSIQQKRSQYYYLFALPKYNSSISNEQIIAMGRELKYIRSDVLNYDEIKDFIRRNITKFDSETLDFLFKNVQDDNSYKVTHWQNFPVEYQKKYLLNKTFKEVLAILSHYECKWSDEDKESFLRSFPVN